MTTPEAASRELGYRYAYDWCRYWRLGTAPLLRVMPRALRRRLVLQLGLVPVRTASGGNP